MRSLPSCTPASSASKNRMVLERDVGEGPSTLPLVQAHIRVRPITVRFTEPGVRDLELKLHTIASLHPFVVPLSNTQHPQQHQQQQRVIFDFDFDTQHQDSHSPALHPPPPPPPVAGEEDAEWGNEVVQELVDVLQARGLMGDDTVRAVKMRMAVHREGVRGRRLRLIHAGRILRDGVRLVGYLDELDLRTRLQTRQTQRLLALSDPHRGTNRIPNGERHSTSDEHDQNASMGEQVDEDKEEEEDQVERTEMSIRQLVDWLSAQLEYTPDDNNTAQIHAGSGEMEHAHWTGKGKGKDREPGWYDDVVQTTIRTARTVYLQCSVGEAEPTSPPPVPTRAASSPLDSTHTPPLVDTSTATLDGDEVASATWAPHRGFNRLLSAGLSASEIAEIRTTFLRSHPLETPYDLIRSHEHAQHLLQMEESWMDNLSSPDLADATTTSSSGGYLSVMHGLMLGFFAPPLIPLFWLRDKPHPSSIPSSTAIGLDSNQHDDADDEQLWHRETLALTRDSVFGNTMQISILFGLVAK